MGPVARNVFEFVPEGMFGVARYSSELPFDVTLVKKRIAFLRNRFYSPDYPLESELFASPREIFERRGLNQFDEYFTSELICLSTREQARFLKDFFDSISTNEADKLRNTFGYWEEPSVNAALQSREDLHWLPYSFQAIWNYEMAWNYPHLFELGQSWRSDEVGVAKAVSATLMNYDFVHFAGSWFESEMWKTHRISECLTKSLGSDDFLAYLDIEPGTESRGKVVPQT